MRLLFSLPIRKIAPALLATGALLVNNSAAPRALYAQTVSYAGGKPSVDVGTANLCHAGASDAGCAVTATLTFRVTGSGTLGEPKVSTLGSPNLDFTEVAEGTTCRGAVSAGQTCTVTVQFAPRFVGARRGGVRVVNRLGKTLASTFLYGAGRGPQVGFDLNSPTQIRGSAGQVVFNGAGIRIAGATAIDGVGNTFAARDDYRPGGLIGVVETPVDGGTPFLLPFVSGPRDLLNMVAVDAAGDVYAASNTGPSQVQVLAAGSSQVQVINTAAAGQYSVDALEGGFSDHFIFNTGDRMLVEGSAAGGPLVNLGVSFPDTYGYGFFALSPKGDIFVPKGSSTAVLLEYPTGTTTATVLDLTQIDNGGTNFFPEDVRGVLFDDGAANLYIDNIAYPGETTSGTIRYQRNRGVPLQFGTIAVTKTATATTRYYNDGTTPLTVTPVFNDLEFKLLSTEPTGCTTGLAPGQYCSLTVAYTPVKTGDQDALMTLKTNGALDAVLRLQSHNVGVVTPVLSVPSGVYTQPQMVSITAPTPGAPIFYTLNGTAPTAASTSYTGPITVGATTTLEAVSIRNGVPSPIAVGVYTIAPGGNGAVNYAQGFGEGCTQGVYGGFQCAGSAYVNGKRLRLTGPLAYQAGIARNTIPISRSGFTTNFTFQLTDAMADGFTFLLETDRPLARGGSGRSLGYAGVPDSMAVKFDLFGNQGEGPNSVGVYFDGAMPTVPAVSLAGSGIDLHSGHVMLAGITYDSNKLNLQLTDTSTLANWSHAFSVDLSAQAGGPTATLFPGFTGGTGTASAIQDILSWSYVSGPPVGAPPMPQLPAKPYFPDGISGQGMRLNGVAAISGQNGLVLIDGKTNEAASAFYERPVSIQTFTTDFTFQSKDVAADGFTLTLQNAGLDALGGRGLQLGYGGIPESVALKFDFHNNAGEGNTSIGVFLNGATPTVPAVTYPISTNDFLRYEGSNTAHVTYDGATLTVTLTSPYGDTWTHSFPVDIPAAVGGKTAYIGFTGGAGTKSMSEQILRWTFSNP